MQQISQNTTWSTGQTITLSDDVQVAPGVTLTINPGVIVEGNGHSISSYGTVYAHGDATNNILFHNVQLGLSGSSTYNGYLDLDRVQIDGGYLERAGQNNYGHFTLTNSLISHLSDYIYAWYPTGPTRISGNIFVDSPGITTGTYSGGTGSGYGSIEIDHNIFDRYSIGTTHSYNSNYAITVFAGYGNVKPSSHDNAFLDTGSTTLVLQYDSGALKSQNDYFGTTDQAVIARMIFDHDDDYSIANTIDTSSASPTLPTGLATSLFSYTTVTLPEASVVNGALLGNINANLTGNNLGNTLIGNSGDNVISAGHGSSVLIGGVGTDTASLPFSLSEAAFDFSSPGKILASNSAGDAVSMSGFEKYFFTDGTVTPFSHAPLVDDLYYYANNKDVFAAHVDATAHYNSSGWHEGRNPNADFSTLGYLAANQDVAKAEINPLTHYDANGWKEGRDPSANFDNEQYLLHNPDVKAAGIDPLAHYLQSGQAEGRQTYAAIGKASDFTHGSFDAEYYLLANPDVARAALNNGGDTFTFAFQHYQNNGWKEGRAADAYFDSAYYLAHNSDVAASGINPLAHYDQFGWKEGRDPSAAFHTNAYLAANPDVAAAHIDPLTHYLQFGADEGRHLA